MEKIKKIFSSRNFKAVICMITGTLIYCIGVVWILNLGKFYASGVTGVSQILRVLFSLLGAKIPLSVFIILLNAPLFIIGWRFISKRFAVLSLGSVLLQSIFVYVLEYLETHFGVNPFANFEVVDGVYTWTSKFDMLTLAILGGLICGVGAALTLKYGASTGGVDIVSQLFVFKKKNANFAMVSLTIDLIIIGTTLLIPQLGGVDVAVFTIIRFLINILVLDKIHTTYKKVRISIVTDKKEEMRLALINNFQHGVTIYEATGGYTCQVKYVFESVVSSFEIEDYRKLALTIDDKVFITYAPVTSVDGKFVKKAIA